MEYRIFQGFMSREVCGEFFEGVRALIVDKDKKPKWKHQRMEYVSRNEVNYFFDRNEKLNLDISKYEPRGLLNEYY